jgi:PIN domain nuclease of toxin-antitoxin system
MNVLLDTCAFIWAIADVESLSKEAVDLLGSEETVVYFSPVSCAEIACLCQKQRLSLNEHWKTWFDRYVALNAWTAVDISLPIIQEAYALPGEFHADPADRIIVGTARFKRMAILTADRKIIDYPFVESVWG